MKSRRLRLAVFADLEGAARYYRKQAGRRIATRFADAAEASLARLEENPAIGSPAHGESLGIPGLRSWRLDGFPVLRFYFERENHLDVVRLLGGRQDVATILADAPA